MVISLRSLLKCFFLVLCLTTLPAHAETEAPQKKLIWQQMSEQGLFDVTLDSLADDSVEINQFLEWVLTVKTADGTAVTPARISISGGMPMHGHGLPSQPQLGEYLGEGRYRLLGLQFSMNGRWELAFDIQSEDQRDKVVFEFTIDY